MGRQLRCRAARFARGMGPDEVWQRQAKAQRAARQDRQRLARLPCQGSASYKNQTRSPVLSKLAGYLRLCTLPRRETERRAAQPGDISKIKSLQPQTVIASRALHVHVVHLQFVLAASRFKSRRVGRWRASAIARLVLPGCAAPFYVPLRSTKPGDPRQV